MAARTRPPWPSILLVGPTGSGKTPLGEEIAKRGLEGRACVHFDFGANLRSVAADPTVSGWLSAAEVEAVRRSLTTGALFEDRDLPMIVRIVERFVEKAKIWPDGLIVLNGLPRHVGQAEGLAGQFTVERVILLEAYATVVRDRLRADPGGDRSGRIDDSPEGVRIRLDDYAARTLPLLKFYRRRGVPVVTIRVTARMTAAEMYAILEREVQA